MPGHSKLISFIAAWSALNLKEPLSKEAFESLDKGIKALMLEQLNSIEQSVKQHTVPEGKDLVTRSYVLNTIEFERQKVQAL